MALKSQPRLYRPHCDKPSRIELDVKFTGAADVQANGYTVNDGPIQSVTRTDEGDVTILLKSTWKGFINLYGCIDKADTDIVFVSETVATDGKINLTFATAGTATDPDSAAVRLTIVVKNL